MSANDSGLFLADLSGSPGLNIQCVVGGWFVTATTSAGEPRMFGCETKLDVLECVLSFLGRPDLSFDWLVGPAMLCRPNAGTCLVATIETIYREDSYSVAYVMPNPPHSQNLAPTPRLVMVRVARWLGLVEKPEPVLESRVELEPPRAGGTLG